VLSQSNGVRSVRISEFGRVDAGPTRGSSGTTATTNPSLATRAAHSFLVTLSGIRASSLDVTMVSSVEGGGKGSVLVQIGADGGIEFRQTADGNAYRASLPFTGTSVTARVTISGHASSAGSAYGVDVTVSPTPQTPNTACLLTPYGHTCSNTRLVGRDVPANGYHVLGLQVSNAIPHWPVVLAIGATTAEIQLPGSSCFLLTAPLMYIVKVADSEGAAAVTLRFSLSSRGTAYLQAAPYARGFKSSNGLRVDCL
jgi:hypothetical protein